MAPPGRICASPSCPQDQLTVRGEGRSVRKVVSRQASRDRRRGFDRRLRLLVSGLALVAVATLVLLHVAVLWERVTQGRLSDPAVGLRWLAAAVLTVVLLTLRQRGVPLLWGRRALVFWLLVLLLHAGAAAPAEPGLRADPVRLLFVVPVTVAPLGMLLVLIVAQLVRLVHDRPSASLARGVLDGAPTLRRGFLLGVAPRAPPA